MQDEPSGSAEGGQGADVTVAYRHAERCLSFRLSF